MSNRLSPERIAEIRADVAKQAYYFVHPTPMVELLGHIEAIEADLAEAKAEIARLKAPQCDHCPRQAHYFTCTECGVMMGDNKLQ